MRTNLLLQWERVWSLKLAFPSKRAFTKWSSSQPVFSLINSQIGRELRTGPQLVAEAWSMPFACRNRPQMRWEDCTTTSSSHTWSLAASARPLKTLGTRPSLRTNCRNSDDTHFLANVTALKTSNRLTTSYVLLDAMLTLSIWYLREHLPSWCSGCIRYLAWSRRAHRIPNTDALL